MRFPFDKPVPRISSPYGWRIHPILKTKRHHNGVDYAVEIGRPVKAIAKGKVIFSGPSRFKFSNGEPAGGGYIVTIRHRANGEWITSSYMHLRKGSLAVKKGDVVLEGQTIALSGNTGESTGPHLHFEIQRGKQYIWTNNGTRYTEPVSYIRTQRALEKLKK
jgi:murein DD-endopeptidase MepM/ murein hydrolase activator NlpD